MPRITVDEWSTGPGGPHPITGIDLGPYAEKILGQVAGLTQFGVRLERLPPGSRSSHRHWHTTEDEFVYVLAGEVVLVEDTETLLRSGDAAGWAAGSAVAHCLDNRSNGDVVLLIVGTRAAHGTVHYPDQDVVMHHDANGRRFTRGDGSPLPAVRSPG